MKGMRINKKLRLQNKVTLTALVGAIITFVYQLLGIFGVVPGVTEETITNLVGLLINILVMLGVVVDPTTAGVSDTDIVMTYTAPRKETNTAEEEWEE